MVKVLKICISEWNNASRDIRELSVCKELGAEVIVLAKGGEKDKGREDFVKGYRVLRYTTRPIAMFPIPVNRIVSVFLWAKYVSKLDADIISGHDILGWTIGWLAKLLSIGNKPILVYDSHEFELGRNTKRNRFQTALVKIWEKKAIESSAFTIVVNDSIADELVRIYGLRDRPIVVRNIPSKWDINPEECKKTRKALLSMFPGGEYILIYHGQICPNRGIEQLINAIAHVSKVGLLVLGSANDDEYLKSICERSCNVLGDRVVIQPAVDHDVLWKFIGAADICVAPIIPLCQSYYFALPNKFFESIEAETPIIATNLPEMKRIIEKYRVGECIDVNDDQAFGDMISKMLNNGRDYYRDGIMRVKKEFNWENEKKILLFEYSQIICKRELLDEL